MEFNNCIVSASSNHAGSPADRDAGAGNRGKCQAVRGGIGSGLRWPVGSYHGSSG